MLFTDIRGFSRLTQQCGPSKTFQLVSELMERIVSRVRQFDDKYGNAKLLDGTGTQATGR